MKVKQVDILISKKLGAANILSYITIPYSVIIQYYSI